MKQLFIALRKETGYADVLWTSLISSVYLLGCYFFIGLKADHLFLVLLFNVLYYFSLPTRKFALGFSIFIVFWVIFDSMKAYPNYLFHPIHIKELYMGEKKLFGIMDQGVLLTPNEYFNQYHQAILDVVSGFFYLTWVPVPLLFAFYLFLKNKKHFLHFSLSFLFVNLIGFVIYYVYPAAPPWYVNLYGFDIHYHTPGNTGGLYRFDEYFGVHVFANIYAKSSNVFAAMPSLHSAYPVVVFYYAVKNKLGFWNTLFFAEMCGIWFAAVYSMHHYILDVMAGVGCALVGLIVFQQMILKWAIVERLLLRYEKAIY
ncbi:MAG: phosphoesterase, PA-phosphatase related [Chitinophagaceae bacterium]|nr:phosphoesterase, PA-phosphatase related [Chitinophagaceae bacterium]